MADVSTVNGCLNKIKEDIEKMSLEEFLKHPNPEEYDFKEILNESINCFVETVLGDNLKLDESDLRAKLCEIAFFSGRRKRCSGEEIANTAFKMIRLLNDYSEAEKASAENIKKSLLSKCYYTYCEDILGISYDCDSSDGTFILTNSVYKTLWGWSKNKQRNNRFELDEARKKLTLDKKWDDYGFGADTMNSFSTTYKIALRIYDISAKKEDKTEFTDANSNTYLQTFAGLAQSIGNFTLIPHYLNKDKYPRGFNVGRYPLTKDYWDLSLFLIQEEMDDVIFRKYIKDFYLDDYVDSKTGDVLPLFKDSILRVCLTPCNEEELNKYLMNVNERIINRGKRMVEKLRETH